MEDSIKVKTYESFKERYKHIPKLLIFKTIDMCGSVGDAFDCLEDFSLEFPMTFDVEEKKWVSAVILENEIKQGTI